MALTNDEAIANILELLEQEERDYAWVARKINKSFQWVSRRLRGITPMHIDDYWLMMSALKRELAEV